MNRLLFATALALALTACTPGPDDSATSTEAAPAERGAAAAEPRPAAPAPVGQSADAIPLAAYHWRLDDAVDAGDTRIDALFVRDELPVQLDFAQGRISISNTCNRMSGAYAVEGSRLRIGRLMSTMMACADDALSQLDQAIAARVEGSVAFALQASDGAARLTLTTDAGDVLAFAGHPTAETRFGGPGTTIFLEVAATTQPCNHPLMPGHECLQVREIAFDEQGLRTGTPGEFQHWYADIEGFTHQQGVRNVLRVLRFERDPAPADGSAYAYVLDLVVESEQK